MKPVTNCMDCKHAKTIAGVSEALARLRKVDVYPYPTLTCRKYGITRERKKYGMRRLPICVRGNGGERKESPE